jgi:predicted GNAT superfamily acetyltransferase
LEAFYLDTIQVVFQVRNSGVCRARYNDLRFRHELAQAYTFVQNQIGALLFIKSEFSLGNGYQQAVVAIALGTAIILLK